MTTSLVELEDICPLFQPFKNDTCPFRIVLMQLRLYQINQRKQPVGQLHSQEVALRNSKAKK